MDMHDLKRISDKVRTYTAGRDELIRFYRNVEGRSLREIAEWAGMSHQQVDNIAKKETK